MYTEDELLPLSALQHLHFCKRQCALIHVEQVWVENLYTVEGRIMHERADSGIKESRGSLRVECSAGAWIETSTVSNSSTISRKCRLVKIIRMADVGH